MALMINVEEFCVFRANQTKLSNGHDSKRCPQCQALRRLTIVVNNETLDMIAGVFARCKPETVIAASEIASKIEGLKTVQ